MNVSRGLLRVVSVARLELLRLFRDPSLIAMWVAIFLPPLVAMPMLGGGAVHLLGLTGLLIPMAVGKNWGSDVESGALGVMSVRSASGVFELILARALVYVLVIVISATPCLLVARVGLIEGAFVLLLLVELALLGQFLATVLRSQQAGWLPLFVAIFGAWVPFSVVTTRGDGHVPMLLKATMAAAIPHLALRQQVFSLPQATLAVTAMAVSWLVGTCVGRRLVVRRQGSQS